MLGKIVWSFRFAHYVLQPIKEKYTLFDSQEQADFFLTQYTLREKKEGTHSFIVSKT